MSDIIRQYGYTRSGIEFRGYRRMPGYPFMWNGGYGPGFGAGHGNLYGGHGGGYPFIGYGSYGLGFYGY